MDDTKTDLKRVGYKVVDWIRQVRDWVKGQVLIKTARKFRLVHNAGKFLSA
jgi:hypothetical protein